MCIGYPSIIELRHGRWCHTSKIYNHIFGTMRKSAILGRGSEAPGRSPGPRPGRPWADPAAPPSRVPQLSISAWSKNCRFFMLDVCQNRPCGKPLFWDPQVYFFVCVSKQSWGQLLQHRSLANQENCWPCSWSRCLSIRNDLCLPARARHCFQEG